MANPQELAPKLYTSGVDSITASHSVLPEVVPAPLLGAACWPLSPALMIPVTISHFPGPILEMPHCIYNDVYPSGK